MSLFAYPLVIASDEFAAQAHARVNQLQNTCLPNIVHPRAVAEVVARHLPCPVCVAAALLHDTMEDTGTTKREIEERFGREVADLVDDITSKAPSELVRIERARFEARRLSHVDPRSQGIKCADVYINVRDVVERDARFARVYVPENRLVVEAVLGVLPALREVALSAIAEAESALLRAVPAARSRRRPN